MFKVTQKICSSTQLKESLPISQTLAEKKQCFDDQIKDNFLSKDRFVVVVGPCSADDPVAVQQYCLKLKRLADKVASKILVVARIYTAKPHSDGDGYLGLAFHENDVELPNLNKGLYRCRQMMLSCLDVGLPIADELLFCQHYDYFDDLVSYWFLGARSSTDTYHRSFASGLNTVVGVKNAVDGNLLQTVQSLYAISRPKVFLQGDSQVETDGNQLVHAVLRGYSVNDKMFANFDDQTVSKCKSYVKQFGLNPFIMVDVSHANSNKVANNQIKNALAVVKNKDVNGLMLESYLFGGCKTNAFGVSKTDDCISFKETEQLILQLFEAM